jgi:hypothetical protein
MRNWLGQVDSQEPPWLTAMLEDAPPERAEPVAQGVKIGRLLERSKTVQAWKHYELTETLLVATIGSIGTAIGMALGGYFAGFFTK